jgi:uncharacterized membrane protein YgdD (TMEM256/DUF423 family)
MKKHMHRQFIIYGALSACISVALGAFAAHGLKNTLGEYELGIWQTAVDYHMYHSLALILIGLLANSLAINLNKLGYLMLLGILLFCGSLYGLSLSGIKALGMITPLGGSCFLLAWLWLALAIYRAPAAN